MEEEVKLLSGQKVSLIYGPIEAWSENLLVTWRFIFLEKVDFVMI